VAKSLADNSRLKRKDERSVPPREGVEGKKTRGGGIGGLTGSGGKKTNSANKGASGVRVRGKTRKIKKLVRILQEQKKKGVRK